MGRKKRELHHLKIDSSQTLPSQKYKNAPQLQQININLEDKTLTTINPWGGQIKYSFQDITVQHDIENYETMKKIFIVSFSGCELEGAIDVVFTGKYKK